MARKQFASSIRGRPAERNEKPMPDSAIDFSDIAESGDQELRKAVRVGRPRSRDAKKLIAIRVRPSLLARIQRAAKERGMPYQTLIHEILETAAKSRL
jgi:predicted DNA binding CopG/RHH family protein